MTDNRKSIQHNYYQILQLFSDIKNIIRYAVNIFLYFVQLAQHLHLYIVKAFSVWKLILPGCQTYINRYRIQICLLYMDDYQQLAKLYPGSGIKQHAELHIRGISKGDSV